MSQRLSKPFWPPALASQAPPAILLAALRRFRGPALFRGLRTSSSLGAPFWPSGLTLRSSGPAFCGPLTLAVRLLVVRRISSKKMPVHVSRTLISVGALALSSVGLIAALFGLAVVKGLTAAAILLVWLAAFTALTRMVLAWIRDTVLGQTYSKRAFLLGCSSLLALPLATLPEALATVSALSALMRFTTTLLFEIVVSLPAIALAWHLNKFHSGCTGR